jgi:hypothetical protein
MYKKCVRDAARRERHTGGGDGDINDDDEVFEDIENTDASSKMKRKRKVRTDAEKLDTFRMTEVYKAIDTV